MADADDESKLAVGHRLHFFFSNQEIYGLKVVLSLLKK